MFKTDLKSKIKPKETEKEKERRETSKMQPFRMRAKFGILEHPAENLFILYRLYTLRSCILQ